MNKCFKKLSVIGLVLLASIVFLSNNAHAVDPPWIKFDGTFSYDVSTSALTMTYTNINTIAYIDGTFTGPAFMGGVDDDPLCPVGGTCGTIMIGADNGSGGGVIYNGGSNSLFFGSSVGGTGNMDLSVFTSTDTYLTATMTGFEVTQDGFGTRLNPAFDEWHIDNITTFNESSNPVVPDSKYINDVESLSGLVLGNLFLDFSFDSDGTHDFTENATGTFLGGKFAVAPEPVSSILFVAGGATLAFRRYRKKRSKQGS